MLAASQAVFTQTSDVPFSTARALLWQKNIGALDVPIGAARDLHPQLFDGVAKAFVDVLYDKFIA